MRCCRSLRAILVVASGVCAPAFPQTTPPLPSQTLGPDMPLTASEAGMERGFAVAVSGNVALVGAPRQGVPRPATNPPPGLVYEWIREPSGTWSRGDTLAGSAVGFGSAIAMEGERALIAGEAGSGKVYYFVRETGHWKLRQVLTVTQTNSVTAVALDDCYAAVGSARVQLVAGNLTPSFGVVQIFDACERHRGQFTRVATLNDINAPEEGSFGASLSLQDRTLVVGEPAVEGGKGTAHVFELRGRHWVDIQTIVSVDAQPGDGFGTSVAYRDGLILVGAPRANSAVTQGCCGNLNEGAAYTFVLSRRGWAQRQTLIPSDQSLSWGGFGTSVAVGDGVLAVGAPLFPQPDNFTSGSVFVLSRQGEDYNFLDTEMGPFGLGQAVVISGTSLLAGAPLAINAGLPVGVIFTGEADIYDISTLIPRFHRR